MKVSKTYFRIIRANIPAILMYFVIFFTIMTIIFQLEQGKGKKKIKIEKPEVMIEDLDKTEISAALKNYLLKEGKEVKISADEKTIKDMLFNDKLDYALIIPKGFSDYLLNGETELKFKSYVNENEGKTLQNDRRILSFANFFELHRVAFGGKIPSDKIPYVLDKTLECMDQKVEGRYFGKETNRLSLFSEFLKFFNYILIGCGFYVIGYPMASIEKPLLKRRDAASGFSEEGRSAGMLICAIISMTVLWIIGLVSGILMTKIYTQFDKGAAILIASGFCHLLTLTAFILLLVQIFPGKNQTNFLSTLVSLFVCFVSGIFIPREFGGALDKIAVVVPTYWEVTNQIRIPEISAVNGSYKEIWMNMGMVLIMGAAIFVVFILYRKAKSKDIGL